eukprot:scaffold968_cov389-Pavlova_lutheri.AAC.3
MVWLLIGEWRCESGVFVKVQNYKSCTTLYNNRRCSIPSNALALVYLTVFDSGMSNSIVCSRTMLFVTSHAIVNDPRAELVVVPSIPFAGLVSEEELQTLNELTFVSTEAIHSMEISPFWSTWVQWKKTKREMFPYQASYRWNEEQTLIAR